MSRRVRGIDTSPRWPDLLVFGGGDHAFDDRQDLRFLLVEVLVEPRRDLFQQRGERRAGVRGGRVLPRGERCRGVLEQHREALMLAVHAGEQIGVEPGPRRQPRPQQFVLAHVVVMEHVENFAGMPGHGAGPGDVAARLPQRRVGAAVRIRGGTCGARSPYRWCRTAFARRSGRSWRPRPPRRWASRGPSRGSRRGCAHGTVRCSRARGRVPARCHQLLFGLPGDDGAGRTAGQADTHGDTPSRGCCGLVRGGPRRAGPLTTSSGGGTCGATGPARRGTVDIAPTRPQSRYCQYH